MAILKTTKKRFIAFFMGAVLIMGCLFLLNSFITQDINNTKSSPVISQPAPSGISRIPRNEDPDIGPGQGSLDPTGTKSESQARVLPEHQQDVVREPPLKGPILIQ